MDMCVLRDRDDRYAIWFGGHGDHHVRYTAQATRTGGGCRCRDTNRDLDEQLENETQRVFTRAVHETHHFRVGARFVAASRGSSPPPFLFESHLATTGRRQRSDEAIEVTACHLLVIELDLDDGVGFICLLVMERTAERSTACLVVCAGA